MRKEGRTNWPQKLAAVWTCKRILKWNESDMWESKEDGGGNKRELESGEVNDGGEKEKEMRREREKRKIATRQLQEKSREKN